MTAPDSDRSHLVNKDFAAVIEVSPTALILVDGDGKIIIANRQAEVLLGYSRSDLVGQSIEILVPDSDGSRQHQHHRINYMAHPAARPMGVGRDLVARRKDGTEVPVEIGLNPVQTSAGLFILASLVDLTLRRAVTETLKKESVELERISQAKTDFVTTVTHELRTPLSAIKEGLSIILDEIDGPLNEGQRSTLKIIKNNVDRLARLVSNVLDFQKFEAGFGKINLERCNLREAVLQVMDLFASESRKMNIEMRATETLDRDIFCDPDRIKQVLSNLLSKALKFSEPGGKITVRVFSAPPCIQFEVRDTGIGISKIEQEKVFQMFGQVAHSGHDKFGGFGVGLAVCKIILEAHGGKIWVESTEGIGSRFSFTIPDRSS